MSGNFWKSSHCNQWLLSAEELCIAKEISKGGLATLSSRDVSLFNMHLYYIAQVSMYVCMTICLESYLERVRVKVRLGLALEMFCYLTCT